MAQVLDEFVIAQLPPPGANWTYSFTLASRTGEILRLIEEQFGERNRSFTLVGVEFCETGPQCWFPGNCGHIVIQLNTSAMNDRVRAFYQLAHECVHLLDPGVLGTASVFEEGVATLFSLEYARRFWANYPQIESKYTAAARLAGLALTANRNIIRELRSQGIRFSQFTSPQLTAGCPGLPAGVASVLCSSFQAWGGEADLAAAEPDS